MKSYVTTPIYYVNGSPHLGHAYTSVLTDVLARLKRLTGKEVFYLTGTDEHGAKIAEAAKAAKMDTQKFTNKLAKEFDNMDKALNISNSYFIRTTDENHMKIVQEIFTQINKNGDIYKGKYKGLYCVGCEAYYKSNELTDGIICPTHKTEVKELSEETYFFKLSKYQKPLLELYKKNPGFVTPSTRFNEIKRRVEDGLDDLSISRVKFDWGVPFPVDKNHTLYVWVDALFNYITGLGGLNSAKFKKFWPADIHVVGKDISWFHSVIWPALLMSLKVELPKQILTHGWWTVDGEKMSKSLGNVIDPFEIAKRYGEDSFRFFLMYNTHYSNDGNFSEKDLIELHNNVLANNIGNLVSRTVSFVEKYFDNKIPKIKEITAEDKKIVNALKDNKKYLTAIENNDVKKAVDLVLKDFASINKYIQETAPWSLWKENKKERVQTIVSVSSIALDVLSSRLYPFMPSKSLEIRKAIGLTDKLSTEYTEQVIGNKVSKVIIFPKF